VGSLAVGAAEVCWLLYSKKDLRGNVLAMGLGTGAGSSSNPAYGHKQLPHQQWRPEEDYEEEGGLVVAWWWWCVCVWCLGGEEMGKGWWTCGGMGGEGVSGVG